MKTARLTLPLLAVALLLASCGKAPPVDRTGRLLSMAGEEAANIPDKMDRFTRQLHIAETQLRTDRKPDAAKTLALARDTLTASSKADFDDFHRIAAWTAISQLSRQAGDRALALSSSDLAQAALNDVQPATDRPQYVLSLAGELADLRGKEAAIELVNSGGAWAAEIVEPTARRMALTAFTDRLLSYEAFENARTMLKRDPDPVWRTDTFLSLANTPPGAMNDAYAHARDQKQVLEAQARSKSPAAPANPYQQATPAQNFGKGVRYEDVYQQMGGGH
jgi:hypothetical protein